MRTRQLLAYETAIFEISISCGSKLFRRFSLLFFKIQEQIHDLCNSPVLHIYIYQTKTKNNILIRYLFIKFDLLKAQR